MSHVVLLLDMTFVLLLDKTTKIPFPIKQDIYFTINKFEGYHVCFYKKITNTNFLLQRKMFKQQF